MQTIWLSGLKGEAKEKRKEEIKSYLNAFEALAEVLEKKDKSSPDYDSPSWAFHQAHNNGYNQAIEDVLKLINIKQED
jgi:hypothetical protein|tara:strand:- start:26038 stop:26271 length:234 start_codon:yes stop_codon:yes gene_type:complete